ncbi:MAG TPA: TIGR03000 domain-containing protein, partial [Pirellulales bacterium]|nr:TIGR03000 domain-containing protein [Pirellulales bacterium]
NWSGTGVGVDVVPSPANTKSTAPGNSVIMNVTVPPDAQVFINGVATTSAGAVRRYRADDLKPGSYPYEVRAEVVRDGQKLVDSQRVDLRTGKSTSVAFDFSPEAIAARRVPTSLTLHVPADAKVYLGDNPTSSTGAVRHFATQLKAGESYSDYKVRVEVNNGGKLETWQEVISLAAGETRELKFDFPTGGTPHVAANSSR